MNRSRLRGLRRGLVVPLAVAGLLAAAAGSARAQGGPEYAPEQAQAGRAEYATACASCHLSTLQGSFEAPELAGPNFVNRWGGRPVRELIDYVRATMPPAGERPDETGYVNIIAYILQRNGVAAGAAPLAADAAAAIGGGDAPVAADAAATRPAPPARLAPELDWQGEVPGFRPVTDAMLREPPPGDWLNFRRTYDGWGYSPLDEITAANVGGLELAWVWAMEDGTSQPTPLVHDGIMYLTNPGNIIQALDAATGDVIWQYIRTFPEGISASSFFNQLRNIAIHGDKIFLSTKDAALVALDARTGAIAWEHQVADPELGFTNVSGPIVAGGLVVNGINGCTRFTEESCFITAHDPDTGEERWRTYTIARPGEPGGTSWGDLPLVLRGGGDSWMPGSYDPALDLLYWPTAQAKPWVPASRGLTVYDAVLYTNSTLAIRGGTGEIAWYFQHVPGEALDLDEAFEKVLIDLDGSKTLFTIGKHGILWKLDRETGRLPRPQGNGLPERIRPDRPADRGGHLPPRHSRGGHRRLGLGLSQHRRRAQLALDGLQPRGRRPDHPPEPDLHGDCRPGGGPRARFGQHRRRSQVVRDARHRRPARQAGGVRRGDARGALVDRAARGVPDRRADHRGRTGFRGRPRPLFPGV